MINDIDIHRLSSFCNIFIYLRTTYIIMDNAIEGRLNRSLAIHSLQNLVFEKRQRKSVSQAPLPIFNKPQSHKTKQKKKVIKEEQDNNEGKNKTQKQKEKTKKILKKKIKLKIQRRIMQKNKQDKTKNIRKSVSSPKKHETKEKNIEEVDKNENTSKNKPEKVSEKKQEKEQINPNSAAQSFQLSKKSAFIPLVLQQESPPVDQSQEEEINLPIKKSPSKNIIISDKPKKGRGRPRKIQPQSLTEMKQKTEQVQDDESQKGEKFEQKLENVVAVVKMNQPEPQVEQVEPAKIVNNDYMSGTRVRRAKFNPLISYNQIDDQLNSDESYQTSRDARRKKKIGKNNRNRYRTNQPYKLNRIFRKEAKKVFACFEVRVDLNNLLIEDFVKQFGVFDLVHFSLPLKFLHLFPSMPFIMEKGFVFLWVQQKETQLGYHLLNRWGYDVIDQIIWIKSNQEEGKIEADNVDPAILVSDQSDKTSELFINMKSTCLVGYKCPLGNKAEYRTKVSNNIIFAKSGKGCEKPSQIYEIADLMMPGGKKLEFGGSSQKGWFNLKHKQTTLNRCHKCFKDEELFFIHSQKLNPLQCQRCLVDEVLNDNQSSQRENLQKLREKLKQVSKTKISQILYESDKVNCCGCNLKIDKLEIQGLIKPSSSEDCFCISTFLIIKDCFQEMAKRTDKIEVAEIISKKKYFYYSAPFQCSQCDAEIMYDKYFECPKSKGLKICQSCFWKTATPPQDLSSDQEKKLNPKITHQWRLKFIKHYPLMKFTCFGCKRDMSLPFWSCQTCLGWHWCGFCDKGTNSVHPHYQNQGHHEYLII